MTNTSGKVTVSREVAEALCTMRHEYSPREIIERHVRGAMLAYPELDNLLLDTLIRALYIGYEVEKSPEEELAEYIVEMANKFNDLSFCPDEISCFKGRIEGARKAAEILGVKLPEPTERTDAN